MECRKEYIIKAKSLDDLREKLDRITDEIAAEAEAELEALHKAVQEAPGVMDKAFEVWEAHKKAVRKFFYTMSKPDDDLDVIMLAYCCGAADALRTKAKDAAND